MFLPVLWILVGFNAVLDLAFLFLQIWIRMQGAKPMRIHADPDPGHTLKSQKVELLHYLKYVIVQNKTHTVPLYLRRYNRLLNGRKPVHLWIWSISRNIANTDPDPGQPQVSDFYLHNHKAVGCLSVLWIRIGFNADPDTDPLFISMRIQIRIQGAKPMLIHVDPGPGPGQTLKSQKVEFSHLISIQASSGTVKFL